MTLANCFYCCPQNGVHNYTLRNICLSIFLFVIHCFLLEKEKHVMNRVTDFNTEEIQSYISNGWFDAQDKLNNPALGGKDKPTVHNGQASNVNRKQASKWNSNKCSTMANQRDFLDELRRQLNT